MTGLDHPCGSPRNRANTSNPNPVEKVTSPAQSTRRVPWPAKLGIRSHPRTNASTPTGTFTQKIHRHPAPLVSAPPISGPSAIANPEPAPKIPNADPRDRPGNSRPISAGPTAYNTAAPAPCTPRDTTNIPTSVDTPHAIEATVKITSPVRNTRRPPKRSANDPLVSRNTANVNAYPSNTHCSPAKSTPKLARTSPNATFTTVRSNVSMNVPSVTNASVHQGLANLPDRGHGRSSRTTPNPLRAPPTPHRHSLNPHRLSYQLIE